MKLTVFNGSPRGKKSNTKILLDLFLRGFAENQGNSYEIEYIVRSKDGEKLRKAFKMADNVLLAFPLYTDAMPGIVKSPIQ